MGRRHSEWSTLGPEARDGERTLRPLAVVPPELRGLGSKVRGPSRGGSRRMHSNCFTLGGRRRALVCAMEP
eukprot:10009371-Karenia_brevis.AAC.1